MVDLEIKDFIRVLDGEGGSFYGGSQSWFSSSWRRTAGCASVAAANLAAYYGLYRVSLGEDRDENAASCESVQGVIVDKNPLAGAGRYLSRGIFLELMTSMFSLMRPGLLGFPYAGRFRRRFLSFALERGVVLRADSLSKWKDRDQAFGFIRSALEGGDPVAMLILRHRAVEISHLRWHWMCITGCGRNNGEIIISNYGMRQSIPGEILLEPASGNWLRLIAFHREK